jgi:hypothetical protein
MSEIWRPLAWPPRSDATRRAAESLLDQIEAARAALPEGVDTLRCLLSLPNLLRARDGATEPDPADYLSFAAFVQTPVSDKTGFSRILSPRFIPTLADVDFDKRAFAERWLPLLFSPALARGAIVELWSLADVAEAARGSTHVGTFSVGGGPEFETASYFRAIDSPEGAAFCERLALERAMDPSREPAQGDSASRRL